MLILLGSVNGCLSTTGTMGDELCVRFADGVVIGAIDDAVDVISAVDVAEPKLLDIAGILVDLFTLTVSDGPTALVNGATG